MSHSNQNNNLNKFDSVVKTEITKISKLKKIQQSLDILEEYGEDRENLQLCVQDQIIDLINDGILDPDYLFSERD